MGTLRRRNRQCWQVWGRRAHRSGQYFAPSSARIENTSETHPGTHLWSIFSLALIKVEAEPWFSWLSDFFWPRLCGIDPGSCCHGFLLWWTAASKWELNLPQVAFMWPFVPAMSKLTDTPFSKTLDTWLKHLALSKVSQRLKCSKVTRLTLVHVGLEPITQAYHFFKPWAWLMESKLSTSFPVSLTLTPHCFSIEHTTAIYL